MSQPIEKIWGQGRRGNRRCGRIRKIKQRIAGQRQLPCSSESVGVFLHAPIERVLGQARGPGLVEPLLEGATLVSPVFVIVAGSHHRANTGEMRRMRNGRQHLGCAHIRSAPHAYFAVRVRQRRRPLHGIVTIVRFVLERIPVTIRGVAAADVLNDDNISRRRSLEGRKPLRRSCCTECAAKEPETGRLPSAGKCLREELSPSRMVAVAPRSHGYFVGLSSVKQ